MKNDGVRFSIASGHRLRAGCVHIPEHTFRVDPSRMVTPRHPCRAQRRSGFSIWISGLSLSWRGPGSAMLLAQRFPADVQSVLSLLPRGTGRSGDRYGRLTIDASYRAYIQGNAPLKLQYRVSPVCYRVQARSVLLRVHVAAKPQLKRPLDVWLFDLHVGVHRSAPVYECTLPGCHVRQFRSRAGCRERIDLEVFSIAQVFKARFRRRSCTRRPGTAIRSLPASGCSVDERKLCLYPRVTELRIGHLDTRRCTGIDAFPWPWCSSGVKASSLCRFRLSKGDT